MKQWFSRINYRFSQWMYGRYGYDAFSKFLLITSIVFAFLSCFPYLQLLYFISFILIVYSLYRSFSKRHDKRRHELSVYNRIVSKFTRRFLQKKKQWSERKTHRFFKCTKCKTTLRVPKGRGKIKVSCPKCRSEMIKKT